MKTKIKFPIKNFEEQIEVLTERPELIFGVTFLLLPENFNLENKENLKAINPANNKEIPVFFSSEISEPRMGVPAHNKKDYEFAQKNNLEIKNIIAEFILNKNVKKEKETVKRHTVFGIVKNKKDNTILCLKWKKTGWNAFPAGGVDENENVIEGIKREITEETGYKNFKFIQKIGKTWFESFWRPHKNSNVFAKMDAYLFELIDNEQEKISEKELEKHEPLWIKENEVKGWINVSGPKKVWEQFINNDTKIFTDHGIMINSGKFDGMKSEEAREKIIDFLN